MKKPLIIANFKMNKNIKELIIYSNKLLNFIETKNNFEIILCPPFTSLFTIKQIIEKSNLSLGAQNMYSESEGSFTGEISAKMLKECGCDFVILGHSERIIHFTETDDFINNKLIKAVQNKLKVILCIGESLKEKIKNITYKILEKQLENRLKNILKKNISQIIIAYEPIWAIGSKQAANFEQTDKTHQFIRKVICNIFSDKNVAENINILYGGSVNQNNIHNIFQMKNINGILLGRACLDIKIFLSLLNKINN